MKDEKRFSLRIPGTVHASLKKLQRGLDLPPSLNTIIINAIKKYVKDENGR